MPRIILSIDQIMDRDKRDLFLLDVCRGDFIFTKTPAKTKAKKDHFDWLTAHNVTWETAAPSGWLEGDPGVYAVHFTGADDPRVAEYTAQFEHPTGLSLDPDVYQMNVMSYAAWLEADGPARLKRDLEFEY